MIDEREFTRRVLLAAWLVAASGWLFFAAVGGGAISMAVGLTIGAVMVTICTVTIFWRKP